MTQAGNKYADVISKLRGILIVSCQASTGEPLCKPEHIAALALSAINGGAKALRLEGAENVRYVRERVSLPIVALTKWDAVPEDKRLSSVYITPTFADAKSLADSGADVIALDATQRPRPNGETLTEIIRRIHEELDKPVWADCSTYEDGMAAAEAGADIVSTTLSGYTAETVAGSTGPNIEMLGFLVNSLALPVILEGKVWHPEEVTKAFQSGAFAVVVGSAITRPHLITERFVKAIPEPHRSATNDLRHGGETPPLRKP